MPAFWSPVWFKSDRCGIETHTICNVRMGNSDVQIRPLRDWNAPSDGTKSVAPRVQIRPLRDWNIIGRIPVGALSSVQIRPLRDWNREVCTLLVASTNPFKSDRCGIETTQTECRQVPLKTVQIRPLRDWNEPLDEEGIPIREFKSDRCGIETPPARSLAGWLAGFKSDRCGIETNLARVVV